MECVLNEVTKEYHPIHPFPIQIERTDTEGILIAISV
jgi:hypothetical protein